MKDKNKHTGNERVVNVKGLKKSFGTQDVLNGIDLELQKGENLVVLGKSGSGKSVLIKCLVRLIEPDEGDFNILNYDIQQLSPDKLIEYRRKVGFLFQGGALYDSMTVKDNLLFPLERTPGSGNKEEREQKVVDALKSVQLEKTLDKWPADLSGGMKKRVALARTLVLRPEIILYDEPTSGLDAVTSKEISDLIVEMQKDYGVSAIIITHDISCAKITSNRISMLRDGVFVDEGTFDELSARDDQWVNSFFK